MDLISLNIEGDNHLELITGFITSTAADVLCLQEVPVFFQDTLHQLGYHTTFAPMVLRDHAETPFLEGVLLASTVPHTASTTYYHGSAQSVMVQTPRDPNTCSNAVIQANLTIDSVTYSIATTHMIVTPDGLPRPYQTAAIDTLLAILGTAPAHILCGDFNMPRHINNQYQKFTDVYTDAIPTMYGSSLDKTIHRKGMYDVTELNAPIFDTYMVDYIFTQAPYSADDVRLQFGVSDHAAVVARIAKLGEV